MTDISTLIIRPEQANDVTTITQVVKSAFLEAEHTSHTEQFIVNTLRVHQQLTISLVAELQQQLVGHVAISPVTLSNGETGWYGLAPVSVVPEMQSLGIGKALVYRALQQLKASGAKGCVVLGDPDYYAQFGFTADTRLTLANVPPEYFQVLSFSQNIPHAVVEYHAAFNATG